MAEIKNICILGSTGSIGRNSLEVIALFPDRFRVAYLTANTNIDLLEQQVARFKPRGVAVLDESAASHLRRKMNGSLSMWSGEEGLLELIAQDDIDIVISAMVGFAGLKPTIEAIKRGRKVALANKEALVVAGEIITRLVEQSGATLLPIDSEHSAILQCLAGEDHSNIARLILTASGGPFLHLDKDEFSSITVDAALKHPNWKMGNKITIDSATLMNKGLEVIEAHWLFNIPAEKIDILIHPQSIIHSMVEFVDGSVKAQLGVPDMKIPIQYALTYPERASSEYQRVDFAGLHEMTFFSPDVEKFVCLALAVEALQLGGTAPTILNAANEIAVQLFLQETIKFHQIPTLIRHALDTLPVTASPTLEDIIAADRATRRTVHDYSRRTMTSAQLTIG
ncbi:MAG: 1-deoxy-D-xylulose-5-phosphate reductoisomerase [Ignavibacteriae bacterium]|nr:1-deoxy-D-xylulose-5-phosphate reductoisomerase [Ignavibacteriota bacterium]